MVNSCHDLTVWQKAIDLVVGCYKLTERFPRNEVYGLASQLQRAAASVPSNIAEGAGRHHTKEYIRHLGIARGSLFEAETQIIIANRLGYASEDDIHLLRAAVVEIGRMLHGLIVSLERKIEGGGG